MKRLALLTSLAALLAATTAHAGWWKTYGGWRGNCIQITSDSNYIISGVHEDYILWLLKTDTSGNVQWSKTYGRSEGNNTRWVEQTYDGGYIVASWTPSLLKIDENGDTLWSRNYGIYSYCVQQTSDSGYIVAGGSNGYGYDESLILVKTDSEGNTIWTQTYAVLEHNRNTGYFIQGTNDGGYVITGLTGVESEEYSYISTWVVKIDSQGDTIWTRIYGKEESEYTSRGHCIRQVSDDGYIVTGLHPQGLWLLKLNSDGDTVWTKVYNSQYGGEGYNLQETSDGGYIIAGVTEAVFIALDAYYKDIWLLKTDADGDTLWTRTYGGDNSDVGRCIRQTPEGGYIVVGSTSSFGGKVGLVMLKTDSLGLLSITEDTSLESAKNWNIVNPIGQKIIIRYSDCPNGFHAAVFDALGRKVDEIHGLQPTATLVWGWDQPSGVYFIQLQGGNYNINTKRTVIVR